MFGEGVLEKLLLSSESGGGRGRRVMEKRRVFDWRLLTAPMRVNGAVSSLEQVIETSSLEVVLVKVGVVLEGVAAPNCAGGRAKKKAGTRWPVHGRGRGAHADDDDGDDDDDDDVCVSSVHE
jgi:hypothetical protein